MVRLKSGTIRPNSHPADLRDPGVFRDPGPIGVHTVCSWPTTPVVALGRPDRASRWRLTPTRHAMLSAVSSGAIRGASRSIHALSACGCPSNAPGGRIRQKYEPGQGPNRPPEPPADRRTSGGQRRVEERGEPVHAAPIHRPVGQDEQAGDRARFPASVSCDLPPDSRFSIERQQRALGIRHDGFHLDDQEAGGGRVPAQNVDGSAVAELVERDFDGDLPAGGAKLGNHPLDQGGVGLVQQAVETFATPPDAHVEVCTEGAAEALHVPEIGILDDAPLHFRDERARRTGSIGQIRLAPAETIRIARIDRPTRRPSIACTIAPGAYHRLIDGLTRTTAS